MNSDSSNPFAAPESCDFASEPPPKQLAVRQAILVVPISLLTAIAGGILNRDPSNVPVLPDLHPMASPGLAFGVGTALAGSFVFLRRRLWMMPLMPIFHSAAFGVTGIIMTLADRRLWSGGSTAQFVGELFLGSLAGMILVSGSLWIAGIVTFSGAIRFGMIGTTLGAFCVVVVNAVDLLSPSARLFWSMFVWHLVMMQYLGWLNVSRRQNN